MKEELLAELTQEFKTYNKLTAMRIAKENLDCWGKTQEEMVKDMKSSTERILKWAYSSNEDFPLNAPPTTSLAICE